jgi:signal transduction histidine kinase/ligand-binding sensor domain-containing protein
MNFILLLLALVLSAPPAQALESKVPLGEYHHDIWTGKDGAPGEVACMAQTADGWLWIGGTGGLFRFDGVRFRRFEPLAGGVAPKRSVTSLTALRNGDLLVGYLYGGLSLVHDGHIRHLPANVGKGVVGPVLSALIDDDGVLWAATSGGLLRLVEGAWRNVGAEMGLPPGGVSNLIVDQYAQMWLAAGDRLMLLERGGKRFRSVLDGVHTVNLSASPDGRLWLDTHERLIPVPPQHAGPIQPRPDWLAQARGQENGLFDRDGNYWSLACPVGVCRSDGVGKQPSATLTPNAAPSSKLDQPWQVSHLTGNILFEDRDGNLWVGTQAGVERFRDNRLGAVKLNGGERMISLARDEAGHVLAMARPTGELWRLSADGASVQERFAPGTFGVIGNGADGALLVATGKRLERRFQGKVEAIPYPADPDGKDAKDGETRVTRIMDDGRALWLTIARRGSFRWHEGKWTPQAELNISSGVTFAAPGARGAMWFGYTDGAVLHFDNGRVTKYAPDGGDEIGAVTFLHGGADVVAGGNAGLAVLRDGRFRRLHGADPDALASVSGMWIAANGDRWINGNKGVVYVKAADWAAALASPQTPLKYVLYGVLDGYPGFAATAIRLPSALADADGDIWFVGASGIARLDTVKPVAQLHPPQPQIETLVAQGRRYLDFSTTPQLPAGTTSFRIEYTALSYAMPEALHFRYQLEGVDDGWQDAGTRRAVSYTKLGPGEYRFRVAAVNQLGQWSEREAVATLRILPAFTQTPLFHVLWGALAAGVLYLLYRLWAKQATLRIATRMAERERIARALHDSFLQSVHGLVLSFQSAMGALPKDTPERRKIERVLLMADKVMEEGRNEVQDLRSGTMRDGDLAHGLTLVGEVLQESLKSVFSLRTAGQPRALDEQAGCEIYSIGREALMNAFRHAGAAQIQVVLEYGAERFSLLVIDDGKGIAPEILRDGRSGHWGLTGLAERAARVGGEIAIGNGEHGGTRVLLTVPAACAYAGQARWKRYVPRWFRESPTAACAPRRGP